MHKTLNQDRIGKGNRQCACEILINRQAPRYDGNTDTKSSHKFSDRFLDFEA